MMLQRVAAAARPQDRLRRFPAVALLGPRQVGKTTLARALADDRGDKAVYLDLERPADRAKVSDVELYLEAHDRRLVVLDEIHRLPVVYPGVERYRIDRATEVVPLRDALEAVAE